MLARVRRTTDNEPPWLRWVRAGRRCGDNSVYQRTARYSGI
jgi:hypothetical protein